MDQAAIKCVGIKKTYGKDDNRVEALKSIDLEIHAGELTLLVGPSGSGKSTLLSIITTILTPDEGQVFLLGHDTRQMEEQEKASFCRNSLGIVFQSLFLIPTLTVEENVSLPLLVAEVDEEEAMYKAYQILTKMNISHFSKKSPAFLSKGQQQRVAIARALVNDAKILVCDEPTSALDQATGHDTMQLLQDLALKFSKAVLVVTHDHRIYPFASRIVKLNDGRIVTREENE